MSKEILNKNYNCPYCNMQYEYDTYHGIPNENHCEWIECDCGKNFWIRFLSSWHFHKVNSNKFSELREISYDFYSYKPNKIKQKSTGKEFLTMTNEVDFIGTHVITKPFHLPIEDCEFLGEA